MSQARNDESVALERRDILRSQSSQRETTIRPPPRSIYLLRVRHLDQDGCSLKSLLTEKKAPPLSLLERLPFASSRQRSRRPAVPPAIAAARPAPGMRKIVRKGLPCPHRHGFFRCRRLVHVRCQRQ